MVLIDKEDVGTSYSPIIRLTYDPRRISQNRKGFSTGVPFSWKGDSVDLEIAANRYTKANPSLFCVKSGMRPDGKNGYWLVAEGREDDVKRLIPDFIAYTAQFGSFDGILH